MKRFFVVLFMLISVSAYGKDLTDTMVTKPTVTLGSNDKYEVFVSYSSAGTGRQLRRITDSSILKLGGVDTTAIDGARYIKAYNSIPFSITPEEGMLQITPTGPKWYGTVTGITDWHTVGGASSLTQLTDWPATVSAIEAGFLDGVTSDIQSQINSIAAEGRVAVPSYSDSPCSIDQWAADSLYHYDCVSTNLWKRFAYGTWVAAAPDTTPDESSVIFTDQTDVALNSTITSASITVTGITAATPISITGGSYDINASGTFVTTSGTVNNNDTVRARHTSASSNSTMTNTTVTIGGVSDTFSSTTLAATLTKYASQTTMVSGAALNDNTSRWGVGLVIDSATSHVVKKIKLNVRTVTGNPSYLTYKMRLYTRNGTALDSMIAESTNAVTGVSGAGFIEFNFAGSTLAQGNVAVIYSTDPADGANFINIGYNTADTDGTYSHLAFYNNSGAQYLDYPARDLAYEIYE